MKDTHIYFPTKLHGQIKRLAKRERHSLSTEIIIAVENHIAALNGAKAKEDHEEGKA